MRVFVTGATGLVGTQVVRELLDAGHAVLGFARSDASGNAVAKAGAEVHRGDLEDLDSVRGGAEQADAVIHTGFIHDFSRFEEVCAIDRRVIETFGEVLAGSDRPLLVTSGLAVGAPGSVVTERDRVQPKPDAIPRIQTELAVDDIVSKGVRAGVVRLPPSVHGDTDRHGFVPQLIRIARYKGASAYIGEGRNHWPAVHVLDAARLYRLALDVAEAGARYHAVGDRGVEFRQIAEVIGKRLEVPVTAVTAEQAGEHFGWFGHFAQIDVTADAEWTKRVTGWEAREVQLLPDLHTSHTYIRLTAGDQ